MTHLEKTKETRRSQSDAHEQAPKRLVGGSRRTEEGVVGEAVAESGAIGKSFGSRIGLPSETPVVQKMPSSSAESFGVHIGAAQQGKVGEADAVATAVAGVRGQGSKLPHSEAIQASFGTFDVSGIDAHVGGRARLAAATIGARAYATGNDVAFSSPPDLHTAAHEAAHVVQQRGGVSLKGGVGQAGDPYEIHADRVADLVVQGKSAESAPR